MNSYQKLKAKYEKVNSDLNMIKRALTVYETPPKILEENGNFKIERYYAIIENKLNEEYKERLTHWVINNINIETIKKWIEIIEKGEK